MNWIKADIGFADHTALLEISRRDVPFVTHLMKIMHKAKPEDIEALLYAELMVVRPELAGCVLLAMYFNPQRASFSVIVSHRSLSSVGYGADMPVIPFFPEEIIPGNALYRRDDGRLAKMHADSH